MEDRTITEMDLQALVDGNFSWREERRLLRRIQKDGQALACYRLLRRQKEQLRIWWAVYGNDG